MQDVDSQAVELVAFGSSALLDLVESMPQRGQPDARFIHGQSLITAVPAGPPSRGASAVSTGRRSGLLSAATLHDFLQNRRTPPPVVVWDLGGERDGVYVQKATGQAFTASPERTPHERPDQAEDQYEFHEVGTRTHYEAWVESLTGMADILAEHGWLDRVVLVDALPATQTQEGEEVSVPPGAPHPQELYERLRPYVTAVVELGICVYVPPAELCLTTTSHAHGPASHCYVPEFTENLAQQIGLAPLLDFPDQDWPVTELLHRETRINIRGITEDDHIFGHIRKTETFYESDLLVAVDPLLRSSDLVVDVGANIGNHSLHWAVACGAQVLSFEPDPRSFEVLRANVIGNGLTGSIFPRHFGLGAKRGTATLVQAPAANAGQTKLESFSGTDSGSVRLLPLDEVLADSSQRVRLIKIDVEGMESEVLQGARAVLERDRPALIVESGTASNYASVAEVIEPLGYRARECFNATPTYLWLPIDWQFDEHYSRNRFIEDATLRASITARSALSEVRQLRQLVLRERQRKTTAHGERGREPSSP